jgi:hypothetical protein
MENKTISSPIPGDSGEEEDLSNSENAAPGEKIPVVVEAQEEKPAPVISIPVEILNRMEAVENGIKTQAERLDAREIKEKRTGRAAHYQKFKTQQEGRERSLHPRKIKRGFRFRGSAR